MKKNIYSMVFICAIASIFTLVCTENNNIPVYIPETDSHDDMIIGYIKMATRGGSNYQLLLPASNGSTGQVLGLENENGDLTWITLTEVMTGTIQLYGDVIGSSTANIVATIAGYNAFSLVDTLTTATSANVPLTLVLRDNTGSFISSNITLTSCLILEDNTLAKAGSLCASTAAVMLVPAGTRALQASLGGNVRGTNAVDLQMNSASSLVASGNYAVITGGQNNSASAEYALVSGGQGNNASGIGSVVVGGGFDNAHPNSGNTALGVASFVGGGIGNQALNTYDVVVSGSGNTASGSYSFVGGGQGNIAYNFGVVAGGFQNSSQGGATFVGCGQNNNADAQGAVVGGGLYNNALDVCDGIVSGSGNNAVGTGGGASFIGGGVGNSTGAAGAFVGGGLGNSALNYGAVVVGGGSSGFQSQLLGNNAAGISSFVGGGVKNNASISGAVVVGGGFDGTNILGNTASGVASFVGGGIANQATIGYDGVVSGSGNTASGGYSFAGGGQGNIANGPHSFVGGGQSNTIGLPNGGANYSVIAGGQNNAIEAYTSCATIGGGMNNTIQATEFQPISYSTIAGGIGNTVVSGSLYNVIGGGYYNSTDGFSSVVVGGGNDGTNPPIGNQALGLVSFIGGGIANIVAGGSSYSGIVSGSGNMVNYGCDQSFIGGGQNNSISNSYATIAGGYANQATAPGSSVAGGGSDGTIYAGNKAEGNACFIGGGINNLISNGSFSSNTAYAAILSGSSNTINIGIGSTIASGVGNTITGNYSLVAGQQANAAYNCFVWSDGSSATNSPANNTFVARASNGYVFYTSNGNVGAELPSGGTAWVAISDKNKKMHFEEVDAIEVLEKVAALPIEKWSYKTQDSSIRHMGPYAQDFYAAFGLGENPLGISTIDSDGVALAAIKGMHQKYTMEMSILKQEILELKNELKQLKSQN